MSVDLKARAAQAVELAQKAGAEDAWSTVSQSRDVQFEYRDGSLEKVKDTTSQSLGVRIYASGRYSSHSTTDLNPERLQDFIAEAVAITAALEPDEYRATLHPRCCSAIVPTTTSTSSMRACRRSNATSASPGAARSTRSRTSTRT